MKKDKVLYAKNMLIVHHLEKINFKQIKKKIVAKWPSKIEPLY